MSFEASYELDANKVLDSSPDIDKQIIRSLVSGFHPTTLRHFDRPGMFAVPGGVDGFYPCSVAGASPGTSK